MIGKRLPGASCPAKSSEMQSWVFLKCLQYRSMCFFWGSRPHERPCFGVLMTVWPSPHIPKCPTSTKATCGLPVVAFGHRPQKVLHLLYEYRVFVVGFEVMTFDVVSRRSGVEYPFRRGVVQPAFGRADAEGDVFAFVDPALRRGVEQFPDEFAFLGVRERPTGTRR